MPGGVSIEPMPPENGNQVTINYSGMLAKKGANDITLCVAYGSLGNTFNNKEISMQKQGNQFSTSFKVDTADNMQFYFKDSQGRKDDNQTQNWQIPVNTNNLSYA